jgi:uncharacterized OsmC-like protein
VVKITLLSEDSIRVEAVPEARQPLTIEAASAEQSYSPFHMLASGLAMCTFSVLASWATHVDLQADDLVIEVGWQFADDPHRVAMMEVTFSWPSLPSKRLPTAERVARKCTVHATFEHPPTITIAGQAGSDAAEQPVGALPGSPAE